MKGERTITMHHLGGATKETQFICINQKVAQCWLAGGSGTYDFKLTNGECKGASYWYITGEDLEFVREKARSNGVKFVEVSRIRLKDRGKKERKLSEQPTDPRQQDLF